MGRGLRSKAEAQANASRATSSLRASATAISGVKMPARATSCKKYLHMLVVFHPFRNADDHAHFGERDSKCCAAVRYKDKRHANERHQPDCGAILK